MASEASELRPGGEAVITRLGDILVIQGIRWWIENDPVAKGGWLRALRDRQIGRVISLIDREPARGRTVASLADEVAVSRSAFRPRFTELVGEPAMRASSHHLGTPTRRAAQPGRSSGRILANLPSSIPVACPTSIR
jgi:hypothetical protein